MRSAFIVVIVALCVSSAFGSISLKKAPVTDVQEIASRMALGQKVGGEACGFCVDFVDQAINTLLNAILNGGVIGGCNGLCGTLSNEFEAAACNLICDYVGIEAFVDAMNDTDPDPIYICQIFDMCSEVSNGSVSITAATVSPKSGPTGSTFNVQMNYNVISATGPGNLAIVIMCPDGNALSGEQFQDAQPVGQYSVTWPVQAQASEQESFGPGQYIVQVAVCEGDCTTDHPYGGIYAAGQTTFTITQ